MSEKVTEINKPEDNEMKLKLSKEYDFEGQKIGEIDLSGLDTTAERAERVRAATPTGRGADVLSFCFLAAVARATA